MEPNLLAKHYRPVVSPSTADIDTSFHAGWPLGAYRLV